MYDEKLMLTMSYDCAIEYIIKERGQWSDEVLNSERGCERHHIVFACKGGGGDYVDSYGRTHFNKNSTHENCIYLYPSEHYELHKKKYYENPDDVQVMRSLLAMLPKGKTKRDIHEYSGFDYEEIKVLYSRASSGRNNPMSGKKPWCYGLTKDTDPRVARIASKLKGVNTWTKGIKLSEETRKKMSDANRRRYEENPDSYKNSRKGMKEITNGIDFTWINPELDIIPDGWQFGGREHSKYEIKNYETFHEIRSKATSGEKNGMYGKGNLVSGGKNGHATIRYFFGELTFECRNDLVEYLRGFDNKISRSTIERFVNGSERVRREHKILEGLTWEYKNESKVNQ